MIFKKIKYLFIVRHALLRAHSYAVISFVSHCKLKFIFFCS